LPEAQRNRAKAASKALGRRQALTSNAQAAIRAARATNVFLGVLAKQHRVSQAVIQRVEKRAIHD